MTDERREPVERLSPTGSSWSCPGLFLTMGSVAFLAWTLTAVLGPAVGGFSSFPVPHRMELHAEQPSGDPDSLILDTVLVDGEPLTASHVRSMGTWERSGPRLEHRAVATPLPMVVEGASVAILVPRRRGSASFEQSVVRLVDTTTGAIEGVALTHRGSATFSYPDPSPPPWWFPIAAVLGLVALAIRLGPWRSCRSVWPWFWIHGGLVHGCYWLGFPVGATTDSIGYLDAAIDPLCGLPRYFPPGYPLFLSWFEWAPPAVFGMAVTAVQHGMVLAAGAAVLSLACRAEVPARLALAGALAGVSCLATLSASQAVMCDFFGVVSVALPLAILLRWQQSCWLAPVAGGLICALGTVSRLTPLPAFAAALIPLVWGRRRILGWRPAMISAACPVFAIAALVGYHGVSSGKFALSSGVWAHLYNHFVHCQKLLDLDGEHTRALILGLGLDPRELPHWELQRVIQEERGLPGAVHQFALRQVTREAMATASIAEHVRFTAELTWRNSSQDPDPSSVWFAYLPEPHPKLSNPEPIGLTSVGLAWRGAMAMVQRSTWWWMVVLGLVGMAWATIFGPGRRIALALGLAPLTYVFCSSAVEFELPRYALPTAMFWTQLVVWPLAALLGVRVTKSQATRHASFRPEPRPKASTNR